MKTFYPNFEPMSLLPVKIAFEAMGNDPLWLERPECNYDPDTIETLRELFASKHMVKALTQVISNTPRKWDELGDELVNLFNELRGWQSTVNPDDKEQLAGFRTAVALLDKIVSLGERAKNIKAVSDFHNKVVRVFDQILTPEQRTTAMEMLSIEDGE